MRDELGDTLQHEWNIAQIPMLEPDPEPREPFQNLAGVVPPHARINPAPFLRPQQQHADSAAQSATEFVPGQTPIDLPRHTRYEDLPSGPAVPRDRWGITLIERFGARSYGPEADAAAVGRATYPAKGIRAGLIVGALVTAVYTAVALVLGYEFFVALVAVGAVIGWRVPAAWARASAVTAGVSAALATVFGLVALTAGVAVESLRAGVGGLGSLPGYVVDAVSGGVAAQLVAQPQAMLWWVAAVVVAAVLGAGVGRVWHR